MENEQTKTNHDIAIALIQKDIEYIKKSVGDLGITLAVMDKNFVRHDEIKAIIKTLEDITSTIKTKANHDDVAGLIKAMEGKLDKKEFEPTQKLLGRINWLLISSVIIGLLALIIKGN